MKLLQEPVCLGLRNYYFVMNKVWRNLGHYFRLKWRYEGNLQSGEKNKAGNATEDEWKLGNVTSEVCGAKVQDCLSWVSLLIIN